MLRCRNETIRAVDDETLHCFESHLSLYMRPMNNEEMDEWTSQNAFHGLQSMVSFRCPARASIVEAVSLREKWGCFELP